MYKKIRNLSYALLVLLACLLFVVNFVAFSFSGVITAFLCGSGINYDSQEAQEARAGARKVALKIGEDGITLVKNQNGTLPLSQNKLAVFGWGSCENGFQFQGGGSGAGSTKDRTDLYTGLKSTGFDLYQPLVDYYEGVSYRRSANTTIPHHQYYQLYEPAVSDDLMTGARAFTDTALFVITRRGTEGVDLTKWAFDQNGNLITNGRKYSTITKDEESLLEKIKEKFDKVIVVFNVANIMESGFVDDDKIDAALMLYTPGNHATPALGEILNGTVTPSGHLVDTVAYDLSTAPSYVNAGATGTVTTADPYSTRNQDYAEDIYIGYYWYETADAEGFWDSDFAKQKWGISNGYKDVVQYPFGYGLSYADFEWEVLETSYTNGANLTSNGEISFKVEVTNKSTAFSGKDVVQLYYTPPYYSGKIEKPVVKLAAFAKTGLLGPGKSEVLTLKLKVRDLACYDCYDKNNNGFMGYEVEGGNYVLSFRSDAHTLKTLKNGTSEYAYTVPKSDSNNTGFQYRKNEEGTYDVVNRFTNYTAPSGASSTVVEPTMSDETKPYSCDGSDSKQNVVYTTRNNFTSTFPVTMNRRATDATFYNNSYKVGTPKVNSSDQMPATGATTGSPFRI